MILTFLWKKNLDEDDDEESKKEQVAMDGDAFSTRNPTNKIPEPSLAEAIALLREAMKLHTTQKAGLGSNSKVNFFFKFDCRHCFNKYKFSKYSSRPSFI